MTLLLPLQGPDVTIGYDITVAPDVADGRQVYMASHPQLPGCMAQGDTAEEAVAQLASARELYLAGLRRRGLEIPEPRRHPVVTAAVIAAFGDEGVEKRPTIHWG